MQAPSPQTLAATEKALAELGQQPRVLDEKTYQEQRSASLGYYEKVFDADKAVELTNLYGPKAN